MEGDAGTSRLNPIAPNIDTPYESLPPPVTEADDSTPTHDTQAHDGQTPDAPTDDLAVARRQERFGSGWLVAICLGLLVLALGVGAGGYFALRAHTETEQVAQQDAVALQRAKECVAATQAPDVATLTASQSKIIECATGDFGVQANFFTGMMVEAYQAAKVQLQVTDLRGAVEKHNDDGTVDVLVAVRTKVTNSDVADQEQGWRLRVKMTPADGTYKISDLDQVTS